MQKKDSILDNTNSLLSVVSGDNIPSRTEIERVVRESEQERIKELKELRKKIRGAGQDVLSIEITI